MNGNLFCAVCRRNICPNCQRVFAHSSTLGRHFQDNSECHEVWKLRVEGVQPRRRHRVRLTIEAKCRVLDDLDSLEEQNIPLAQTVVAIRHGTTPRNISAWNSDREKLFCARKMGFGHLRTLVMVSRVLFSDQEDKLYLAFLFRRKNQGYVTTDAWLQDSMRTLLEAEQPDGWEEFKASNGWVALFKKRYRITAQCQTNKKHVPITEKLPLIRNFHAWLLTILQLSTPQKSTKYGRFPATFIFHMDQIPLPFVLGSKRTLNSIGEPVFIRAPKGSGLDKRQATLQLCIRAEGSQLVRLAIIFKGQGLVLSAEERKVYAKLSHWCKSTFSQTLGRTST